jgi:hypothetical protein
MIALSIYIAKRYIIFWCGKSGEPGEKKGRDESRPGVKSQKSD